MALALLLDLDGTLLQTIDAIVASMNAALAEVREPPLTPDELRPLIGMPVERQLDLLRGMHGPAVNAITDRYYEHFLGFVEAGLPLYPGVSETLAALADRPIGTMTTRRRQGARRMLEVAGIDGYFRAIVGGDDVERPKPAPDLPRHAAKALRVRPQDCVVVGDAAVDILAGRAARTWTIAATYGYGDPRALREAKPHTEIARFTDLPKALDELEAHRGARPEAP
ncbi:MAG: HAD family hydrolase [Methanobacteriota archaeon]